MKANLNRVVNWWRQLPMSNRIAFAEYYFGNEPHEVTFTQAIELHDQRLIDYNEEEGIITKDCEHCDDGTREEMKACFKPASMCCGGCSETIQCVECDGSGVIELEL